MASSRRIGREGAAYPRSHATVAKVVRRDIEVHSALVAAAFDDAAWEELSGQLAPAGIWLLDLTVAVASDDLAEEAA